MPATILDGKAMAAAIRDEPTQRVAALPGVGHRPGLGTLLVGDDRGSRWYVNAKHSGCAHTGTRNLAAHVRAAAILGGVVSRVEGKIAPDVAPDVVGVAGQVAPNPGGVGPMTRAMLLQNGVLAAEQDATPSGRP